MVIETEIGKRGSPGHQGGFRPKSVGHVHGGLPQVKPWQKPTIGSKFRVDAGIGQAIPQMAPLMSQVSLYRRPAKRSISFMLSG